MEQLQAVQNSDFPTDKLLLPLHLAEQLSQPITNAILTLPTFAPDETTLRKRLQACQAAGWNAILCDTIAHLVLGKQLGLELHGGTGLNLTNRHSVEPRRCGENGSLKVLALQRAGSPPQVRGKRDTSSTFRRRKRITPAGAGKTARCTYDTNLNRDHPRRCGENIFSFPNSVKQIGSPPQVRGKLLPVEYLLNFVRITPAGAGKTEKLVSAPCRCQDHPRRCGENHQSVKAANSLQGSPTQVRGKRIKRSNVI